MLDTVTTRFFILDEKCAYTKILRQYNESVKLYAELVDKFCAEYNIIKESHRYRSDYRLDLKISKQEKGRLYKEYGSYYIRPGTILGCYWVELLRKNKTKNKFIGFPKFKKYLPWKIYRFKSYSYEYCGYVYVAADGDGIETIDFPEWCREITGEVFYRNLETVRLANRKQKIN